VSENITKKLQLLDGEEFPDADDDPFAPQPSGDESFHEKLSQKLQERNVRTQAARHRSRQEQQAILNQAEAEQASIQASPFAFHLFDSDEVDRRIKLLKGERNPEACKKCLEGMKATGGYALLVPQPTDYNAILDELKLDYPHFDAVIEFMRTRMRLNGLKSVASLTFGSNVLLDGPAGIGKSSFLMTLSQKMNTAFYSYSCASTTNSFDLTGLSAGYGTGRSGKLHELLAIRQCPNPIILLDEIEKAGPGGDRYNITGALYGLLELNNARQFKDEFIDVKMDASKINWFATSNHASQLDAAIRDRFEVLRVRAPSQQDLRLLIPRLYQRMLVEMELDDVFSSELSETMLGYLSESDGGSIRRVRAMLVQAMSCASARAGQCFGEDRIELEETDIAGLKKAQEQAHKRRMNYII